MQSLPSSLRSLVGLLQACPPGSLGAARLLVAGIGAQTLPASVHASEPTWELHSRWASGWGTSCSFSSSSYRDGADGRSASSRRAAVFRELEDLESHVDDRIDEAEIGQQESETEQARRRRTRRRPNKRKEPADVDQLAVVQAGAAAGNQAESNLARWLPDRMQLKDTRKERMRELLVGREPDEKDDELMDPLELKIWLKEHFMKQELPLSDSLKELIFRNYWDKVLVDVRRTVKVTKSAKLDTFHAVACVGNFEGLFGVGIASSNNAQVVVGEAYMKAYQNLVPVPLYRGHTIYHKIEHKYHTIKMILMPRPAGYGLVCNPVLRQLCVMIGIKDISIKVMGRRNRRNKFEVVKCFLEALQKQSTPHDGIEGTGIYAREIFYRRQLGKGLPCGLQDQRLRLGGAAGQEFLVPHGGVSPYAREGAL